MSLIKLSVALGDASQKHFPQSSPDKKYRWISKIKLYAKMAQISFCSMLIETRGHGVTEDRVLKHWLSSGKKKSIETLKKWPCINYPK